MSAAPVVIGIALAILAIGNWPVRKWPKTPKNVIRRNGQFRDA